MQKSLQEAYGQLVAAENSLRSSVISALSAGLYGEVPRITGVLKELRSVIESLEPLDALPEAERIPDDQDDSSERFESDTKKVATPSTDEAQARRPQSRKTQQKYPRFFVRDDQLVKLGWSANSSKEYEHRVPRAGVDAFADYLSSLRRSRFPITAEAIAKGLQKEESQRILGYQVYVVAGWLKSLDLLVPEGRQGYFLKKDVDLAAEVSKAWEVLENSSSSS